MSAQSAAINQMKMARRMYLEKIISPEQKAILEAMDVAISHMETGSELTGEEIYIGQNKNKILAIKALRERTGMGLADTKNLVENEFRRLNLEFKQPPPIVVPEYPSNY